MKPDLKVNVCVAMITVSRIYLVEVDYVDNDNNECRKPVCWHPTSDLAQEWIIRQAAKGSGCVYGVRVVEQGQ